MKNQVFVSIGTIIAWGILLIIAPAFAVAYGWLLGFLIELLLGARPTEWLNHALGTERFAKGDIAKITALLAIIRVATIPLPKTKVSK